MFKNKFLSKIRLADVFSNYVSNKIVTFNDKDPPWMTQYVKSQINWRNNVYQENHRKRNHSADDFIFLENVIYEVSDSILNRKNVYLYTSSKTYWSISKTFYHGRKVPLIPPLFNKNQSRFRPADSREYQLLSIVHDIYASFDCNPPHDVRGVFLDISKAFDRVWH